LKYLDFNIINNKHKQKEVSMNKDKSFYHVFIKSFSWAFIYVAFLFLNPLSVASYTYDGTSHEFVDVGISSGFQVENETVSNTKIYSIWYSSIFFADTTYRKIYVSKMKEWKGAQYLRNGHDDYDSVIATNVVAYHSGGAFDVYGLNIYVDDELVHSHSDVIYTEGAYEVLVFYPFDNNAEMKIEFEYEAYFQRYTTFCTFTLDDSNDVFSNGISVKMYTGDIFNSGAYISLETAESYSYEDRSGFDYALSLDGETQYVDVPLSAELNPAEMSFTAETWFKVDNLPGNDQHIIEQLDNSGTGRTWLGVDDNGQIFTNLGGSILSSNTVVNTKTWYHAAVTYDNSTVRLYLNGKLESFDSRTIESNKGDLVLGINKDLENNLFDGALDETRIWNEALSKEDIQKNMNLSVSPDDKTNLLLYYSYASDSDNTISDETGNYDGNLHDASWTYSSDHFLSFDGEDDYMDAEKNLAELGIHNFTLEAWIKTTSSSVGIIACNDSDTSWERGEKQFYLSKDGIPTFVGYGNGYIYGTSAVNDGEWHHIAVTWDYTNESGQIFVDGINDTSNNSTYAGNNSNNSSDTFKFGVPNNNESINYFKGDIDEIRIWGMDRSQSEIQSNMNIRLNDSEDNLVAYYNFELNDASDLSGNAYDGTLNGGAEITDHGIGVAIKGSGILNGVLPNGSSGSYLMIDDQPSLGTILLDNSTGEFTYTPNDFSNSGTDSFTYYILDSENNCGYPKTVNVTLETFYALELDGSGDYIDLGDTAPTLGTTFTQEAWIYPMYDDSDARFQGFLGYQPGPNYERAPGIWTYGKKIHYGFGDGSTWNSTTSSDDVLTLNDWNHVAVTFDGADYLLYVNGLLVHSTPNGSGKTPYSHPVRWIGRVDGYFEGIVDEVRIWDTVRTQSEIQENMGNTLTGNESGLVAYYQFNEGSGTTVTDSSSSGNDGTIGGDPQWVESNLKKIGTLTATIQMYGDADPNEVGAKWNVGGDSWFDSGETVYLVEGDYTVTFNSLTDYTPTSDISVVINEGFNESVTGTYKGCCYALEFDGSDDYVELANESAFDFTNTFTVETWIKVNRFDLSYQAIIAKGDDSWRLSRNFNYNTIHFAANKSSGGYISINGTTDVNDGKWHHIAAVADGTNMYLYIDGLLEGQIAMTDTVPDSSYPVYIGENSENRGRYFDGQIDEVRIWNTSRTQTEIQENMGNTLSGNENGLLAYYQFNEGDGNTATDIASSGNEGTIEGDPQWVESSSKPVGTLIVTIQMYGDADPYEAGAQWNAGGDSWFDSGETVYLVEGDYTVTFNSLTDYTSPSDITVVVTEGGNESVTGTYKGCCYALEFDGSDDYVELANESAFDFTNTFTVETWIKVNRFDLSYQAIIAKGDDSWRLSRNFNYNTIHFAANKSSGGYISINGTTDVNDGKWHHIAAVADGTNMYLYIDGLLEGQIAMTDTVPDSSYPVYIGENSENRGRYFDGQIDEVRIWNNARTQTEIQENMGNTLTGNENGLLAYYQFNEGDGNTATDSSTNANDGTIYNDPQWVESEQIPVAH
jgi:hypothetical protein